MNSEVAIRQVTPNGIPQLKEIIDLSFPKFFRYFASHSVNSEEGKVLVTETQSIVSGFAKLIEFKVGNGKYGCILWIAVHPERRRKGIALSLVKTSIENFKHDDVEAVFASVRRSNKASLATLSKMRFVRMGFLSLWRLFGFRIFSFYRDIWYAPVEVVLMHSSKE